MRQGKQEDQDWDKHNQERKDETFPERTWIAILVVVDNYTRQCLEFPNFRSGPHVTNNEAVTALRIILLEELAFLIGDQGIHFHAKAIAQLTQEAGFIHVPIYRPPQAMVLQKDLCLRSKIGYESHPGGCDWLASYSP